MIDTIFALSSGRPPAGVAVLRISGPSAGRALAALAGSLPQSRRATLRRLVDPADGTELDRALVLWMPGPGSATGEDCAEIHCHGGRAVVAAIEAALGCQPGLRRADPGEFTRRAFANGRIDLAEAEGLADLLEAETELQRRTALAMADGTLSRAVESWRMDVLRLSAMIEATLDFSDEGEVGEAISPELAAGCSALAADLDDWLARPRAEPLREGFRVVLAGPPNAGKSTLFNALIQQDAAITAPEPGTTRDVLTSTVSLDGLPFTFVDTAGLREEGAGTIEQIGIARARSALDRADLVLWLGPEGACEDGRVIWEMAAQSDRPGWTGKSGAAFALSAVTGEGMARLRTALVAAARDVMPSPGAAALNQRQHDCLSRVSAALGDAAVTPDPLIVADELRAARAALDALVGRTGTEDMLDSLFGRFCIGK